MRHLRNLVLLLLWLALAGLANYELVQKSPRWPLGELPGARLAGHADLKTRYRPHTGIMPVDRVLHEGQEAYSYYRGLATGRLH